MRLMPDVSPSRRSRTNKHRYPNHRRSLARSRSRPRTAVPGAPLRLIPDHPPVRPGNLARSPFRRPEMGLQMRDSLALDDGRQHFLDKNSFIAAMSGVCSASSFFNLVFSSSSAFSRLASDTVIPAYFAHQVSNVPSDIPCLRQRSAHSAPASYSCSMPMLCSSVRIVRPFLGPDSSPCGGEIRWQVGAISELVPRRGMPPVACVIRRSCRSTACGWSRRGRSGRRPRRNRTPRRRRAARQSCAHRQSCGCRSAGKSGRHCSGNP